MHQFPNTDDTLLKDICKFIFSTTLLLSKQITTQNKVLYDQSKLILKQNQTLIDKLQDVKIGLKILS